MATEYYVRRAERVFGPLAGEQLQKSVTNGQVLATDEVAASRTGPWAEVSSIPQLALLLQNRRQVASPPPAPPPAPTVSPAVDDVQHEPSPASSQSIAPPPIQAAGELNAPPRKTDPRSAEPIVKPDDHERRAHGWARSLSHALAEGKQRVADAYAEAVSRVDESETLLLGSRLVLGRGIKGVDKVLPHPQVSLRHALVEKNEGGVWISDLGSDSGTFVGGRRCSGTVPLSRGSVVTIGPYSLVFDGENLVSRSTIDNAQLLCQDLTKVVVDRSTGQSMTILNRVTLAAHPREVLVIMGPSGSGKSTLLNALSARELATSGHVVLNGRNVYANFDALKKSIALVPQKDILHENLRLLDTLLYTAQLRLPPDLEAKEILEIAEKFLDAVNLGGRKGASIRDLSGGEVKRASVANEIISEPNLLFIDEATSGLDEYTDGEIMEIFRRLAEDGKTVICITHNLANVAKHCHKVAILAKGGFLAFHGAPEAALAYFKVDTLGSVYGRLKDCTGEQWRDRFEATAACRDMYTLVDDVIGADRPDISRTAKPTPLQRLGNCGRQLGILLRREIDLQATDYKSLLMLAGQCLFVSVLIALLFAGAPNSRANTASILFLLSISAFWFGCNNAAKELVKEKAIYERERAVGLNVISYYCSKLILLATLTLLQIATLFAVVCLCTHLQASSWYLVALVGTGVCGVSLGMCISALAPNADVAATAVPIAVIPQVILSGMIREVTGLSELVAAVFVTCYWSFGSLAGDVVWSDSLATKSYVLSVSMLALHAIILNFTAIAYLYGSDKRWMPTASELDGWLKATAKEPTDDGKSTGSRGGNP